MTAETLAPIDRNRGYSTEQAAAYLGWSTAKVRELAQTGQFGDKGAWERKTAGGHVYGISIAGWAIEAYIKRNAL